jgi:hypothetical protein
VLWIERRALSKKLFLHLAYFLAILALMLSPWVYRNYSQFGAVALSTQSDRNLYVALLPSVISIEKGISFNDAQAPLLAKHPNNFTFANSAGMTAYSISTMARYPIADMKMALLSGFTFFTADGVSTVMENVGVQPSAHLDRPATSLLFSSPILLMKTLGAYLDSDVAVIFIARIIFIMISVLFLVGLYWLYRFKQSSKEIDFTVLLVVYFMLTTVSNGLAVTARFRMPIEPIILGVAYVGYVLLKEKALKKGIS